MTTPTKSIDISARQTIRPTGAGITTTWNPQPGLDRQAEIEQARLEAQQEYQKQQQDTTPLGLRISRLEEMVAELIKHAKDGTNC